MKLAFSKPTSTVAETRESSNGGCIFMAASARMAMSASRSTRDTTRVTLALDMLVQRIEAHPAVDGNAGRVALQRGPVLYCLEETDNGNHLHDILLPRDAPIAVCYGDAELGAGVPVLTATAWRRDPAAWTGRLYSTRPSPIIRQDIRAIPYYLWNNRRDGEMLVWIRDSEPLRSDYARLSAGK